MVLPPEWDLLACYRLRGLFAGLSFIFFCKSIPSRKRPPATAFRCSFIRGVPSSLWTSSAGQACCFRKSWSSSIVTVGSHSRSVRRRELTWYASSGVQIAPCATNIPRHSKASETSYVDFRPPVPYGLKRLRFKFHNALSSADDPPFGLSLGLTPNASKYSRVVSRPHMAASRRSRARLSRVGSGFSFFSTSAFSERQASSRPDV